MNIQEEEVEDLKKRLEEAEEKLRKSNDKNPFWKKGGFWKAIVAIAALLIVGFVCMKVGSLSVSATASSSSNNDNTNVNSNDSNSSSSANSGNPETAQPQVLDVQAAISEAVEKAAQKAVESVTKANEVKEKELQKQISDLAKKLAEKPAVLETPTPAASAVVQPSAVQNTVMPPVEKPNSNHQYLSGVTPQNLTLGEWQEKITERADNFVDINGDAEFRKVFKQFSPPETKDGQVRSYVLVQLPGESRMRFWDSKQQPPIQVPSGFTRFARDEVGSWMVVK